MAMKISRELLMPILALLGFTLIASLVYFQPQLQDMFGKTLAPDAAAQKAIDYVNENMLAEGIAASYKDVKSENGLYAFKLTVQDQDYAAYVTKDGALMFAEGIPQAIILDKELEEEKAAAEMAKSDKPDVKLFVMSYCPYGLQAQKMYLPVYDLLKDKTEMGIYFVDYAMHGKIEIDENLRQYCIQKEQKEKIADYLECFTADTQYSSCTNGDCVADYGKCLSSTGIDQEMLSACIAATDEEFGVTADYKDESTWLSGVYPKFAVNGDLNEEYGIQGSPTIVINGKDVSDMLSSRSPEAFKKVVCMSFTDEPEECLTELSNDPASTGFGGGTSASADSTASCGG